MPTHYQGTAEEKLALDAYIKLMRAAESVSRRLSDLKTHEELSVSQFGALEALYHLGPMYQKDIGEKILKSSGNITMVVNNLEDKGLVERKKDRRDRRFFAIHLTDEGRETIEEILPDHFSAVVQIINILDSAEQQTLGELCKKLGYGANATSVRESSNIQ
ncbi:MAG TPA: MarR family transcriptional regulator [bacterium]|nr:MarR family transcriptional regulator [bacterium]